MEVKVVTANPFTVDSVAFNSNVGRDVEFSLSHFQRSSANERLDVGASVDIDASIRRFGTKVEGLPGAIGALEKGDISRLGIQNL